MWRCRCGETNLSADTRCRSCEATRALAEMANPEYRPPRRWKSVQVGFFGLGIDDPRGEEAAADTSRWSEADLDEYYRREARRSRRSWLRYLLIILGVLAVLVLQILRRE